MSEITRYEGIHGHMRSKKGRLVLFTDHDAAIALKDGTIQADDERLIAAAEKAGVTYMGCDTADWLAETVVELRAELAACRISLEKIRVDSGNRPGHEGWNYYCKRLHTIHMIAHNALKEAEDASA